MRKVLFFTCLTLWMSACHSEKTNHKIEYLSEDATDSVSMELFLSEYVGLNIFHNICADDSFLYCSDVFNDSVLKVYPLTPNPTLTGYATKGQGPDDLIFPIFTKEISQTGVPVKMIDSNLWSLKEVAHVSSSPSRVTLKTKVLPVIPMTEDFAETDSCIYATDIDSKGSMFYIYNKNTKAISYVNYWESTDELERKYPEYSIPSVVAGHILLNPLTGTLCKGMLNQNSLLFYDLQGKLLKEVIIGKEKKLPPTGEQETATFDNENKYVFFLTGTAQRLYALYNGYPIGTEGKSSKIMELDWNGRLLRVIQTDKDLARIAIDANGNYLYATVGTEEGGTDVVRLAL